MDSSSGDYKESFLEKLDMFGIGISIRFSQKSEHTTQFGGLITLSIFAVIIFQLQLIVVNFFNDNNPTLLFEQNYTLQPGKFSLSPSDYSLAFGLQDLATQTFLDQSQYKVSMIMHIEEIVINSKTNVQKIVKQQTELKIKQCSQTDFSVQKTYNYFSKLDWSSLHCIDTTENNVKIEGQDGAEKYVWLQVLVSFCGQSDKCGLTLSPNIKLVLYYTDNTVISTQRDAPFQPFGAEVSWISSINFSQQIVMKFRDVLMSTDTGFFTDDYEYLNNMRFSYQNAQNINLIGDTLFDLSISMESNFQDMYRRSYQKLDKSFSQMGGTFNMLFAVGALLCKPISQVDLNRKLINRIFNFQDKEESESPENQESKQEPKKESCKSSNSINYKQSQFTESRFRSRSNVYNINTVGNYVQTPDSVKEGFTQRNLELIPPPPLNSVENQNIESPIISLLASAVSRSGTLNVKKSSMSLYSEQREKQNTLYIRSKEVSQYQNDNPQPSVTNTIRNSQHNILKINQTHELDKFFKEQNSSISYKSWEHFVNFFKVSNLCRNRKQKLLQKGVDRLYDHIDIFYLIQKLIEVEKLKYLLLNENQIKLFEFIPRPILRVKEKKVESISDKVGILYHNSKSQEEKITDARLAFQQIVVQQPKISKIDLRIMELLDPKFKQCIKEVEGTDFNLKSPGQTQYQTDIMDSPPQIQKVQSYSEFPVCNDNNTCFESTSENLITRGQFNILNKLTENKYNSTTKKNQLSNIETLISSQHNMQQ